MTRPQDVSGSTGTVREGSGSSKRCSRAVSEAFAAGTTCASSGEERSEQLRGGRRPSRLQRTLDQAPLHRQYDQGSIAFDEFLVDNLRIIDGRSPHEIARRTRAIAHRVATAPAETDARSQRGGESVAVGVWCGDIERQAITQAATGREPRARGPTGPIGDESAQRLKASHRPRSRTHERA